jgi:hypothetical protein
MAQDLHRRHSRTVLFDSASIREVIALMPAIDLVITPDTSVVHIASAFNTPIIALFGCSDSNFNKFRPLSDTAVAIRSQQNTLLGTIKASQVISAIREMGSSSGAAATIRNRLRNPDPAAATCARLPLHLKFAAPPPTATWDITGQT